MLPDDDEVRPSLSLARDRRSGGGLYVTVRDLDPHSDSLAATVTA